jgi:hypothetical protein
MGPRSYRHNRIGNCDAEALTKFLGQAAVTVVEGDWPFQETNKWNTSCCRVSAVSEFMVFLPLSIKFAVSQKQNIDLIYVLSLYALTPTLAPLALRISSLVPASLQSYFVTRYDIK